MFLPRCCWSSYYSCYYCAVPNISAIFWLPIRLEALLAVAFPKNFGFADWVARFIPEAYFIGELVEVLMVAEVLSELLPLRGLLRVSYRF